MRYIRNSAAVARTAGGLSRHRVCDYGVAEKYPGALEEKQRDWAAPGSLDSAGRGFLVGEDGLWGPGVSPEAPQQMVKGPLSNEVPVQWSLLRAELHSRRSQQETEPFSGGKFFRDHSLFSPQMLREQGRVRSCPQPLLPALILWYLCPSQENVPQLSLQRCTPHPSTRLLFFFLLSINC